MVSKGLKKGAIFEDDGLLYVVMQVMPDGNYVSRHISKEKKEEIETARKRNSNAVRDAEQAVKTSKGRRKEK